MKGLVHSEADGLSIPSATLAPVSAPAMTVLAELAAMTGADIWERYDAGFCRELEKHGLVRIVKAKHAPKNGALRQPYFGCKATAAGRKLIASGASA